jgi:N-acetylmuramoyl-L-alanine amidase CwlA
MKLEECLLPLNIPARPGIKLPGYDSITIHWIGPYPMQSVQIPRQWWIDSKQEASAHYIVKDENVLLCIPTDEVAWHCGCKAGNYSSIGIEVVPFTSKGEFSAATIDTLKELIATLKKVKLVRHYDWTGKDCPKWYTPLSDIPGGDERWEQLKEILCAS